MRQAIPSGIAESLSGEYDHPSRCNGEHFPEGSWSF
jgi:hypothetical protein